MWIKENTWVYFAEMKPFVTCPCHHACYEATAVVSVKNVYSCYFMPTNFSENTITTLA